jgi:ABC-type sugar transport system ATPase subunit
MGNSCQAAPKRNPVGIAMADLTLVRHHVGMVFQQFNLFPHMTALENCTLAPVSTGRAGPREAKEITMQLLARVHVQDHAHKGEFLAAPLHETKAFLGEVLRDWSRRFSASVRSARLEARRTGAARR